MMFWRRQVIRRRAITRPRQPALFHFSAGVLSALVGAGLLWGGFSQSWTWQSGLSAWLTAINLTALGYYGFDKVRARRASQRVPEAVLHLLALVGGSVGAYLGMQLFRHKTLKGRFQLLFWSIVVTQVGLIAWLVREFHLVDK